MKTMPTSRGGFSLLETLVALLMVSLAAMLLVKASAANALVLARSIKSASAVRLASEFSAWTYRHGHRALGMPLDQAMDEAAIRATDCDEGYCSAAQGAWHYLSRWRERVLLQIPDARIAVCIDGAHSSGTGWSCDASGDAWVLKLGWPPKSGVGPSLVVELGPVP